MTKIESVLKVVRIHEHAKFQPIPPTHSQENAWQPVDLLHKVKILPKWGKSTNCDQNVINSKGVQDTSACLMLGHSSHMFARKSPETANVTCFTKSKCYQNAENQQKITKILPISKVVRPHEYVKFQATQSDCNKNTGFKLTKKHITPLSIHVCCDQLVNNCHVKKDTWDSFY